MHKTEHQRGHNGWSQQWQDDAAQGVGTARPQCERGFVQAFVQLAERRQSGAHTHGHVAENKTDDQNEPGARQLEWRHVEGHDVGNADDCAGDGKAQHGHELEAAPTYKLLTGDHISGEQANDGGQRCGNPGDHDGCKKAVPGRASPVDATLAPLHQEAGAEVRECGFEIAAANVMYEAANQNQQVQHGGEERPRQGCGVAQR